MDIIHSNIRRFMYVELNGTEFVLNQAGDEFKSEYVEHFGHDPSYDAAFAYDMLMIVADAVKSGATSQEEIIEYLSSIEDYNGAQGGYTADGEGEIIADLFPARFTDGSIVGIGN